MLYSELWAIIKSSKRCGRLRESVNDKAASRVATDPPSPLAQFYTETTRPLENQQPEKHPRCRAKTRTHDSLRYFVIHPERLCLRAAASVNTSRLELSRPRGGRFA